MSADRRHRCWFVCKQLAWTISPSQPRCCIFYNHARSHFKGPFKAGVTLSCQEVVPSQLAGTARVQDIVCVAQLSGGLIVIYHCIHHRAVNCSTKHRRYVKITLSTFATEPPFPKAEQLQRRASQVTRTKSESRFQARLVPIQL